jgi:hypothetical protein
VTQDEKLRGQLVDSRNERKVKKMDPLILTDRSSYNSKKADEFHKEKNQRSLPKMGSTFLIKIIEKTFLLNFA